MSPWLCQACGHNRSHHRDEWDRFRGERDTSCKARLVSGDRCRCDQFE